MSNITVCYSTHRPETLGLTGRLMQDHDVIILEEPFHNDFTEVLNGNIELKNHMLELDAGYPEFTLGQYQMLRQFSQAGKQIVQIEPYLEHLLKVQYFLAEDHSPEEIEPNTMASAVYSAEREATGRLIDYYNEVRGDNFSQILSTMNNFAKADAARFILRDSLRVNSILEVLDPNKDTYIEAGSIHLLLSRLLCQKLSKKWHLQVHSVDREIVKNLNQTGSLFSPGDELTLSYIWDQRVSKREWELKCAQTLIYSKIINNEETLNTDEVFPHTRNEIESISAVQTLAIEDCKTLFQKTRTLNTKESVVLVKNYLK